MGLEYQQNLGLAAMGSGKLFGKGLFSKDFIEVPEMHNDFIFSHIGQSLGFVGAVLTIVFLAYICIKVLNDSRNTMDLPPRCFFAKRELESRRMVNDAR